MNKNALRYFNSAQELFLDPIWHDEIDGFELQFGRKKYYFRGSFTPFNQCSSVDLSNNKYATNDLLRKYKLPVAKCISISKQEYQNNKVEKKLQNLNYPIVLKPNTGAMGSEVICGISNIKQVNYYLKTAFLKNKFIIAEEFHGNLNSYRILVFKNQVLALVQRFSAQVTGDGIKNIDELIKIENINREKITSAFGDIKIDQELLICLESQNLTLETIIETNKLIKLNYTCNATRGGTYIALKKTEISQENKDLLIKAAQVLQLDIVGFDVECINLQTPIASTNGIIVEANINPSIRIHEKPLAGSATVVSKIILKELIKAHPVNYFFKLYKKTSLGLSINISIIIAALLILKLFISS